MPVVTPIDDTKATRLHHDQAVIPGTGIVWRFDIICRTFKPVSMSVIVEAQPIGFGGGGLDLYQHVWAGQTIDN